jgi:hypothetical protein
MSDTPRGDDDDGEPTGSPDRGQRRRRFAAAALVVVVLATTVLLIPAAWARRTLVNEDRYLATVDEIAAQPAIQEALATEITTAVFDALDVEQRLSMLLQDRVPEVAFLAGPISDSVEGFVETQVLEIVRSEAFLSFWRTANRFIHEQALAVLRGESEVIQIQGDEVVLNYLPLVNSVLGELSSVLSDLLGRPVTLPTITADTVPSDAIAMLEGALGVQLPETFGQVTVFESDDLAAVQQGFRITNATLILLVVLFVVCTAVALWISPTRRRTLLQLSFGVFVIAVFQRRGAIIAVNGVVADVGAQFQPAAQAVADVLLDSLLQATQWVLVVTGIVAVAAVASGPYPWVVSTRSWVEGVMHGAAGAVREADAGPVGRWIADRREGVMIAIAAVAVIIWFAAELSFGGLLLLAALAVLAELAVWRSGPSGDEGASEPPP